MREPEADRFLRGGSRSGQGGVVPGVMGSREVNPAMRVADRRQVRRNRADQSIVARTWTEAVTPEDQPPAPLKRGQEVAAQVARLVTPEDQPPAPLKHHPDEQRGILLDVTPEDQPPAPLKLHLVDVSGASTHVTPEDHPAAPLKADHPDRGQSGQNGSARPQSRGPIEWDDVAYCSGFRL